MEERGEMKRKMIFMYKKLETFLKKEDFKEDFRTKLEKSNKDYLEILDKRRKDIEKTDDGIIITGETCSGKSTLINKILRKKIFEGNNLESTCTICKIRDSERIKIITESYENKKEVIDLTDKCKIENEDGVKLLRDRLKNLTDKTASNKSMQLRSVDVGFPIPFLKGNTILVDTPGVGGSGEVTPRLIEYLPNAVSFIFVISVNNAGGMQKDRLPAIFSLIEELKEKKDLLCCESEDVIFITNKWDAIRCENEIERKAEISRTWEAVKSDIQREWPSAKEENIFRINILEVSDDENDSTREFRKFQEKLVSIVKKTQNIRILQHLSYLQSLLRNILDGLNARLDIEKQSEKELKELEDSHRNKIRVLNDQCKQVRGSLNEKTKSLIEDTAQKCYDYMSTDLGKDRILNPASSTPIMEVFWQPLEFAQEVNTRVKRHVDEYLQSEEVLQNFENIKEEIVKFHKSVLSELSAIDNELSTLMESKRNAENASKTTPDTDLLPLPIRIPIFVLEVLLSIVLVAASIIVMPISLPVLIYKNRDEEKKTVINEEYNTCRMSIRSKICNHLESSCGKDIKDLIDKSTQDILPKQIQTLERKIKDNSIEYNKAESNVRLIDKLVKEVQAIENQTQTMQVCLTQDK